MQMWMPTILAMAERDGWVVIPIVKSSCVPARGSSARGLPHLVPVGDAARGALRPDVR